MYEELFHSPDRPFRATPDTKFYFPYESIETARQTVVRAVMRAEGPVMVLGGAGLGKSLLGMIVAEDLAARFDVVKLYAARLCSRRALLQNILFELQLAYRGLTEGDLRLSILDRLEPAVDRAPDGVLLIVDEAHTLPVKLLDELRLITNFTRGNQPRVRLVLIGNLKLEHTFAEPQMESFNQRLAARCYLQPMDRQQNRDYVRHQLATAGVEPQRMITEEALHTVYAASEGVPRLTNQIMDHSLVLAITRGQCPVSAALVEEAWADLQQLPAPWHAGADNVASTEKSSGSTIEFDTLRDEDDISESNVEISPAISLSVSLDDSELRLADEATDEYGPSRRGSFFAAFAPPEGDSAADLRELLLADEPQSASPAAILLNSASDNCDAACSPARGEHQSSDELLTRPQVIFDLQYAREQARKLESCEADDQLQLTIEPDIDQFFADRPTDERLLALQAEQFEMDSLGVWENDPPLGRGAERPSVEPLFPRVPMNLFGDDFEEEVCVSVFGNRVAQSPAPAPQAAAELPTMEPDRPASAALPDLELSDGSTQDYLTRMQLYAEAIEASQRGESPASARPAMQYGESIAPPELMMQSAFDTWSVDVAAVDTQDEVAVAAEIEDLVSQLNFAAFSVEPFSVEQIDIRPRDKQPSIPVDSIRTGRGSEVYALHRPQDLSEESVFNGWSGSAADHYDDDRDLIVVEEELPLTAKSSNEAEQPVTKIAPYSQLFAKLRK